MDVAKIHAELSAIRSEPEAADVLHRLLPQLGADVAVFASYIVGDPTLDSYRFILSAPKAFCDSYQTRFWFLNDPCLVYANGNTRPIRLHSLPVTTPAQRSILDEAARSGFQSGLIVPVHGAASSSRASVLILGANDPHRFASAAYVDRLIPSARLMAMELHDFIASTIRRQVLQKANLSDDDLMLLRLQRDGFQSRDIAAELQTTPAAIDARFARLTRRLGLSNRRQAVAFAAQHGLVD